MRKQPSYRRHKASGQAVVTIRGKDHYLGPWNSPESEQKYRRLLAEYLAQGDVTERASDLTVSEVLAAYWAHAQGYYARGGEPTSQLDRVRRSLAAARELYGSTRAGRFGPVALQAVRAAMVRQGWCRRVVNQRVGCLKRAFKWAAAQELVPASVHHGLTSVEGLKKGRTLAPEHAPVPPAPEAAVARAKAQLPHILADCVELQLLTAARPGEALALRPCDLDRTGDVWLYRPRGHKGEHRGHQRVVYLGPLAQALLKPHLDAAGPEEYVFSPRRVVAALRAERRAARKTPVQPSQRDRSKARPKKAPGERYSTSSYAKAVAKACERAGCEHWHPHQLRHTAASRIRAEFGIEVAQAVLGHRHLQVTEVYAEPVRDAAVEAVRRVG